MTNPKVENANKLKTVITSLAQAWNVFDLNIRQTPHPDEEQLVYLNEAKNFLKDIFEENNLVLNELLEEIEAGIRIDNEIEQMKKTTKPQKSIDPVTQAYNDSFYE